VFFKGGERKKKKLVGDKPSHLSSPGEKRHNDTVKARVWSLRGITSAAQGAWTPPMHRCMYNPRQ
jgi:hypothetical protein